MTPSCAREGAVRATLAVGLVLIAGLVALFVLRAERVSAHGPLPGAPAPRNDALAERIDALGYARQPEREEPPVEPSSSDVGTARSFLAEHYGARWSEVEARMLAAGVDLDVPYVFHPWEEAEALIGEGYRLGSEERAAMLEQQLVWPAELTVAWVREEFATGRPYPLAEEDLPLLADLVADLNLEILGKAELWTDSIDVALQERFLSGRFVRMPYTNKGLDSSRGFYAKGVGGLGWATSVVLTREDYPELAALESEIGALRRQRYERVVRFLHGRIAR